MRAKRPGGVRGSIKQLGERKKVSGSMLVQQDLQELIGRLNNRMDEALRLFGQKRTRDHFKNVFFIVIKSFPFQHCV